MCLIGLPQINVCKDVKFTSKIQELEKKDGIDKTNTNKELNISNNNTSNLEIKNPEVLKKNNLKSISFSFKNELIKELESFKTDNESTEKIDSFLKKYISLEKKGFTLEEITSVHSRIVNNHNADGIGAFVFREQLGEFRDFYQAMNGLSGKSSLKDYTEFLKDKPFLKEVFIDQMKKYIRIHEIDTIMRMEHIKCDSPDVTSFQHYSDLNISELMNFLKSLE